MRARPGHHLGWCLVPFHRDILQSTSGTSQNLDRISQRLGTPALCVINKTGSPSLNPLIKCQMGKEEAFYVKNRRETTLRILF